MIDVILFAVAGVSYAVYGYLSIKRMDKLEDGIQNLQIQLTDLEQRLEILNRWVDKLSVDNIKSIRSLDGLKSTLNDVLKEQELKQRIAGAEEQYKYYGKLIKDLKSK